MSRLVTRSWPADPAAPGGRAERRSFRYQAFVPDPVADLQLSLPGDVAGAVSRAERAVDALNRDPPALASLEVLARRLLRWACFKVRNRARESASARCRLLHVLRRQ